MPFEGSCVARMLSMVAGLMVSVRIRYAFQKLLSSSWVRVPVARAFFVSIMVAMVSGYKAMAFSEAVITTRIALRTDWCRASASSGMISSGFSQIFNISQSFTKPPFKLYRLLQGRADGLSVSFLRNGLSAERVRGKPEIQVRTLNILL